MELHGGHTGCVKWRLIFCTAWGMRSGMLGVTCMAHAARLLPHGMDRCLAPARLPACSMHAALSQC